MLTESMPLRSIIHILLHFLIPGAIARIAFRRRWEIAWLVMTITLVVDLDHMLAIPAYDPNRCSLGFHPLHSAPAIGIYAATVFIPKLRLIAIGLLVHMLLDWSDCIWMKWG
jgi:hypothetical protein